PVCGVAGREPGERLRPGRRWIEIVIGSSEDAVITHTVLSEVKTVDVRPELTRMNRVALATERDTEREVDRLGKPQLHRLGNIECADPLFPNRLAGKERQLVGYTRIVGRPEDAIGSRRAGHVETRSERRVEGVADLVLEIVVPERPAKIVAPTLDDTP